MPGPSTIGSRYAGPGPQGVDRIGFGPGTQPQESDEPPPFAPTDIAGLLLWLKADSLVLSDADPVVTWADSSGNGNDVTQGTANLRPTYRTNGINGLPVVRFDGTNDFLTTGAFFDAGGFAASVATMFIVLSPDGIITTQFGIVASGTAADEFDRFSDGDGYSAYFRSARINNYPSPMFFDGDHMMTVKSGVGAGNYAIYIDGVSQGVQNPAWGVPSTFIAGRDSHATPNYFPGDIAEILIYNSALSSGNQLLVEDYLRTEYATP